MPYDEARYISRDTLSRSIAGTQTYTASAVVLTQTVAVIPFPDAGWVVDGAAAVDAIGVGVTAGYQLLLANGTTVVATGSITNTANAVSGLTVTTASSVIAANGALSLLVVGTGTSSAAQVNPVLQVNIGIRKQFV